MMSDRLDASSYATALPFFKFGGHLASVETADDFRVTTLIAEPLLGRVMVEDIRVEDDMTFHNTSSGTIEGLAEVVTDGLTIARIARASHTLTR